MSAEDSIINRAKVPPDPAGSECSAAKAHTKLARVSGTGFHGNNASE